MSNTNTPNRKEPIMAFRLDSIDSIELSFGDGGRGWRFRLNGYAWHPCVDITGATPSASNADEMALAVVAIANHYGETIRPDDVGVLVGSQCAFWPAENLDPDPDIE